LLSERSVFSGGALVVATLVVVVPAGVVIVVVVVVDDGALALAATALSTTDAFVLSAFVFSSALATMLDASLDEIGVETRTVSRIVARSVAPSFCTISDVCTLATTTGAPLICDD
jgi:hypothetical protein